MSQCPFCNSSNVRVKARRASNSGDMATSYQCKDCEKCYTTHDAQEELKDLMGAFKTFIVSSAQNNTPVNEVFLNSLINYKNSIGDSCCLMVIPVKYKNPNSFADEDEDIVWDASLRDYIIDTTYVIDDNIKILGSLKINSTAENPLNGLDSLSKGKSVIIGHQQLQMKTLPVQQNDTPVIMTTTGAVTDKNYSISKVGAKADFNHSFSAVVVEVDGDAFHIRHLNFDGNGFYDLNKYYTPTSITENDIHAIVTGDEHVIFVDDKVKNATYGKGGIVDVLKPKFVIRHDIIDCYSISHHHKHNVFTRYAKAMAGVDDLSKELDGVIEFLTETTLDKSIVNIIVDSNHNNHITQWLNECDPKLDMKNALLYHKMMYKMLEQTTFSVENGGASYPNPLELYTSDILKERGVKCEFISRGQRYKLKDIEISEHGDKGNNGSRGNRAQFALLPTKTIIGHSHSPGITKGCYQVGTSSRLRLEYNHGASSWMNSHCIITENGKRQLINIINGKWRR